jgi:hypothetical protein
VGAPSARGIVFVPSPFPDLCQAEFRTSGLGAQSRPQGLAPLSSSSRPSQVLKLKTVGSALRAFARWVFVALAMLSLVGCATSSGPSDKDVQRATEGPTADEVFMSRFLEGYGRLPTFDESAAFRIELEQRVSEYLTKHPDLSTSPRASQFTFHRRVSVGMSKEEVALLAGTPKETTQEEEPMRTAARQFWPAVKQRAKEMWVYPGGWQFYFEGDRLVDLTVFGKPPL